MLTPQKGLLALYCATFILAINGVLSKAIQLDAITITWVRCSIAVMALTSLFVLSRQWSLFRLQNSRSAGPILLVGLLMAIHWSSFFHAMQISTIAIGTLAHYSFPVITVLLEAAWDKRRPALADLAAAGLVIVGVAWMMPSWQLSDQAVWGLFFGLVSAFGWSLRNTLQKRYLHPESGQTITAYQLLVIILVTLPLANFSQLAEASSQDWQLLLILGLVSTALGHTLISISLRVQSAKSIALISCLQPPLAILLGAWLLDEWPPAATLLGGTLILLAALYEAIRVGRSLPQKRSE